MSKVTHVQEPSWGALCYLAVHIKRSSPSSFREFKLIHSSRANSIARQESLGRGQYEDIYRRFVLFDLAEDMDLGFFLAYYRNFSVPSLAKALEATGEIRSRPQKRSYDTAIVIYEIIAGGLDSERGQAMVALLRNVHRGIPGSNTDFVYVLMTMLVVPIRWVDRHAWRPSLDVEKQAAVDFFAELGARMGLRDIPQDFAHAEEFLDDYEREHVDPSPAGLSLMRSTLGVLRGRLSLPLRPLTEHLLAAMLADKRQSAALGIPQPNPVVGKVLTGLLKFRAAVASRRPLRTTARFRPGFSGSSQYPSGYALEDLGPIKR